MPNTYWEARLTNPQGTQLLDAVNDLHLDYHTTREPIYWPTNTNRKPDLLDFFNTNGVAQEKFTITSCLDLTSDLSTVSTVIQKRTHHNYTITEQTGTSSV